MPEFFTQEWLKILAYSVHATGLKCHCTCVSLFYLLVVIQYAVFRKSLITFYITLYIYMIYILHIGYYAVTVKMTP